MPESLIKNGSQAADIFDLPGKVNTAILWMG